MRPFHRYCTESILGVARRPRVTGLRCGQELLENAYIGQISTHVAVAAGFFSGSGRLVYCGLARIQYEILYFYLQTLQMCPNDAPRNYQQSVVNV